MNEEEAQIVVGKLQDPQMISTVRGAQHPIADWDHRAKWSFMRLQFGRSIDKEIHNAVEEAEAAAGHRLKFAERIMAFDKYFDSRVDEMTADKARKVQFILDQGDAVMAVASLKHLLIPPSEVYEMAGRIVQTHYPDLNELSVEGLQGDSYIVKEVGGLKLGVQIFGGDIITRQAITVSSMLRVELCFNPLSWLGVSWFKGLTGDSTGKGYERLLRIKVREELEPRLREAIEQSTHQQEGLEKQIKKAKKTGVTRSEAEIVMAAFGMSYSLGAGTIEQILDRLETEAKTQYGMSMASSWVAAHGDFRATPEGRDRKVEQKLSTISGAAMLLDDMKEAKERSEEWLQGHIKQGEVKTIDELLHRIGADKLFKKRKK